MTEFTRLFDVFSYQQEKNPVPDALSEKINGQWVSYSTADILRKINALSRGLYRYGIKPGDKVAIISGNRPAWNITDLAIMQVGGICIPIYPNISLDDYRFIFRDAEIKLAFVSDKSLHQKIKSIQAEVPSLKDVYTFNRVEGARHWEQLVADENTEEDKAIEAIKGSVKPNDLATIIYTSGTTGTPKGVMLSHDNIVSNVKSAASVIPIKPYLRVLSALPVCHVFERTVTFAYMYIGCCVYYAERVETIGENLREVKPGFFTAVPRILEKAYERIMDKGHALKGVKRALFFWAHGLAEKYEVHKSRGPVYNLQLKIARRLIFSKWKEGLGGNVFGIVIGAAALSPRLARIFNGAGIPVREGYGQTESSPVVAVNRFESHNCRIGTVGPAIPGVQVKLAEDGEILVKGPNVMLGYYKRPDLTADAINPEGWLHTGDIGTWVEGKFLKITDRKKELFKTSGGKYIAPQVIENQFKESPFIEQIMIIGENRKTVSALIVPAVPKLEEWVRQQGLNFSGREEMLRSPEVHKKYASIRDEFNRKFSDVEKVKKFALLPGEWSVETGEMTPTLKLKRKIIAEKYKAVIGELYGDE
jgi:long-chain acyl-CoA synthetase